MPTTREGIKPVQLVVDAQVGVMENAWEAPRIIGNVDLAVERARAQDVPAIWVHHSRQDLPEGSAARGNPHRPGRRRDQRVLPRHRLRSTGPRLDLTLVRDAHSTETMDLDDGTGNEAAHLIKELNLATTWLSYPGRTNGTVAADEIHLSGLGKPA